MTEESPEPDETIDLTGLKCPLPLAKTAQKITTMDHQEVLGIHSDAPAFKGIISSFCKANGHSLIEIDDHSDQDSHQALIRNYK